MLKSEYQELMFQCDNVMREISSQNQAMAEREILQLDAAEMGLVIADYDELRKK